MGKTMGEKQKEQGKASTVHQKNRTKSTPFSARQRIVGYSTRSSNKGRQLVPRQGGGGGGCSGALSMFSFRDFRVTIDAPEDRRDEMIAARALGLLAEPREEEESTPSLKDMDEEEDEEEEEEDDIIPFDTLSECMISMTTLETNEMVKSFDLYMQQQHQCDCCDSSADSVAGTSTSTTSRTKNPSLGGFKNDMDHHCVQDHPKANNEDGDLSFGCFGETAAGCFVQTPEAPPMSLGRLLRGDPSTTRSTSSSSVDGIHLKNGFEPDLYTLDGIRKELFFGNKWW